MDAAQHAQRRLQAGIELDDWPLYDAGKITGYAADGSYIKGPNWTAEDDDRYLESEDDGEVL